MNRSSRLPLFVALVAAAAAWLVDVVPPGLERGIDYVQMHAFYRAYHARSLAGGRLPLWNPHVELGRPFLADIETATLYPPNLLYLAVPQAWGVGLLVAAHLALAAVGAATFARQGGAGRLAAAAAGVAFTLVAPVQARLLIGQLQFIEAIIWLPWILVTATWLVRRPSRTAWLLLAAVVALQILAGHPQAVWISMVAAATLVAGRQLAGRGRPAAAALLRDTIAVGLAFVFAAGLAAAQVLPTAELARESNRASPSIAFAGSFAVELEQLPTLLAAPCPSWRVNWEQNLFLGIGLLSAATGGFVAAIRRPSLRPLVLLAGLSIVFAVGSNTPLFTLFYAAVPGTSSLRFPGRLFIAGALAITALAAAALSRPPRGSLRIPAAAAAAVVGCASLLVRGWVAWHEGETPSSGPVAAAVAGAVAACFVAACLSVGRRHRLFHGLVIAAVACSAVEYAVVLHGFKHLHATEHGPWRQPDEYPLESVVARTFIASGELADRLPPPRVAGGIGVLRPNAGMEWGYGNPMGYGALALDRVWWQLFTEIGEPVPTEFNTVPILPPLDRQAVRYQGMDLRAWVFETGDGRVVLKRADTPQAGSSGRAWLCGSVRLVEAWRQAARAMWLGHDVTKQTLVEERFVPGLPETLAGTPDGDGAGSAAIVEYAPERIVIDVAANAASLLVIAEPWYPGWTARSEGDRARSLDVIPVNGWMRGIVVPTGAGRVVMTYEPASLRIGAMLSAGCIACWVAAWFWRRRR